MEEIRYCAECGTSYWIEDHHIIRKSQVKPLDKCPGNHVDLCNIHHRDHSNGIHFNRELDRKYRLKFQNWLEMRLLKNEYELEEIQDVLQISFNATKNLCKLMTLQKGKYIRENIIRTCMGGKMVLEGETNE